jgi:tripartite-type tricarboxylate transporter receptor subunit TctC
MTFVQSHLRDDTVTKLPHRRQFLHLAAGAAALPPMSRFAWAQAYPTRPVRWIVPYPAGGPTDVIARLIGQWLSARLSQQFVIENRPGGAANIGTEAVVRSPPDGYTLLLVSGVHAINATLFDKLNYNFIRDITPIAGILRTPAIFAVHPSVPLPNSLLTPRLIRARSIWHRPAMDRPGISRANCSR